MRAAALQVLAQVCSFSAAAGFSVVGFTELDPFDGRVRRSAVQTHRPLAPTAGVCLSCPTISPAWVRRGATLGQTRLQMKLPGFGLNAREMARLSPRHRHLPTLPLPRQLPAAPPCSSPSPLTPFTSCPSRPHLLHPAGAARVRVSLRVS